MKAKSANSTDTLSRTITPESFRDFLAWLDQGANSDGESYLKMRRLLVAYFDRRNCVNPEELADETLNRVARRLAEEGGIATDSPAKYCYTLARFVLLEYFRSVRTKEVSLDSVPQTHHFHSSSSGDSDERKRREILHRCLDECVKKLEPGQRELVLAYYQGELREKIENRQNMAASMGLSTNALSIRACRIRGRLELCVKQCAGRG